MRVVGFEPFSGGFGYDAILFVTTRLFVAVATALSVTALSTD